MGSANLFNGSRRLFTNSAFWTSIGASISDSGVTDWDGTTDASTATFTGNWTLSPTDVNLYRLPSGTYTIAVYAKSNTGANQQFSFTKDNTVTRSNVQTATSAWQRFSYTFTGSPTLNQVGMCSTDGSTGAMLQFSDLELYAGSTDLGPQPYVGHMYLGQSAFDTRPSYSSGAIDLSTGGWGTIQFGSATTIKNVTVIALASKVSAGSSYQGYLSKIQNYNDFSAVTQVNAVATDFKLTQYPTKNLWNLTGQGWHAFGGRYDGTNLDTWLDDMMMFRKAVSLGSVSLRDYYVGLVNGTSLPTGYKIASIAIWPRALSDSEYRSAYAMLVQRASVSGITATPAARIYVAEGDSITAAPTTPLSYAYRFGPNANPTVIGEDIAVSGSALADMNARAANLDAIIPPNRSGRKFILSVLIGANGIDTPGLATYLDARRAAGWKVVLCTILPRTADGFNALRDAANTTMRGWVGVHADAIADFAADPTMGPDAAAANTALYSDGTHPTDAGQTILESIIRPVINAL